MNKNESEEYVETVATRYHYVNNKELFNVMKEYRHRYLASIENKETKPEMPKEVAFAIMQIATKMSRLHNFIGYSYRSDMISDAIMQCTAKFHNFNPERSDNFFAYASQICWNAFVGRIKTEQKQTSIRSRLINEKVTTDFIQQNLENDVDGTNAFVDFLKENEIFVDYYEQRKDNEKSGTIHPSLKHRNLTAYTKKPKVKVEDTETNIFELSEDEQ